MNGDPLNGNAPASVAVVVDAEEEFCGDETATWAVARLRSVLAGLPANRVEPGGVPADAFQVNVALARSSFAAGLPWNGMPVPEAADSFAILRSDEGLTVVGADGRGLAYGVLELADVARLSDDPMSALQAVDSTSQRPATPESFVLAFRRPLPLISVVVGCLVASAVLYQLFAPLMVLSAGLTAFLGLRFCYRSLEGRDRPTPVPPS